MQRRHASIPPHDLRTAEEVSARLRLPLSTVYYLAKTGRLPAIQLGRSWRFPALEIERLAGHHPRQPSLLVVDDDELTQSLVAAALQPRGCQVLATGEIAEALAMVRQQQFNLLLIDLKLAGRAGAELTRQLQEACAFTPMVVLGNLVDLALMPEWLALGPLTLIRKPFSPEQLNDWVERVLGGVAR